MDWLGAISALLIAAIIWRVAGRVATTVTGQGIPLQGGHVYGVVSPIAGEVTVLFVWSYAVGPPFEIRSGTLARAAIALGEERPISYVLPGLR